MQKHVIEAHEEGREYIICPVKHCECAVRDLRFHMRVKHSSLKIPQLKQMQALVMYDVKSPTKRKKLPNFKEGFIVSGKNDGRKMQYRSSYEEQTYLCLPSY